MAVTAEPDDVIVAFQKLVIDWPDGQVQLTVQPVIADEPAVTVAVAWKPLPQLLSTCQVAAQVPVPPVGGGVMVEGGVGLAV